MSTRWSAPVPDPHNYMPTLEAEMLIDWCLEALAEEEFDINDGEDPQDAMEAAVAFVMERAEDNPAWRRFFGIGAATDQVFGLFPPQEQAAADRLWKVGVLRFLDELSKHYTRLLACGPDSDA